LPFDAAVWTAVFPYGAVWLLPVAILAGIVAVEFLGFAQPVRRSQVWLIERALDLGLAGLLLWGHRAIQRFSGPEGTLVAAVVREQRDSTRNAVIEGSAAVSDVLQRLQVLCIALLPDSAREGIAGIEVLALAKTRNEADTAGLAETVERAWPDLFAYWERFLDGDSASDPIARIVEASGQLGAMSPEEAAVATLAFSCLQASTRLALLHWHEVWAQLLYQGQAAGLQLREAEGLIQFEYWAAHAEGDGSGPGFDALLSAALPSLVHIRDRGERAARRAGEASRPEVSA
jgi:hypothetical protein